MDYRKRFVYVYATYQFEPTEGNELAHKKWQKILEADVAKLILEPAKNFNAFSTIQHYASPREEPDEAQWCDLYFDLDGTFEETRQDAVKLVRYFCGDRFQLPREYVRVWFSGGKGFHVLVNAEVIGCEPHPQLTYVHKRAALFLEGFLELKTLDSKSIYSVRRMWRIPDSHHHRSGLFKVELTHDLLMNGTEQSIKEWAKKPQGPLYEPEDVTDLAPDEDLKSWWHKFRTEYEDGQRLAQLRPAKPIAKVEKAPACVVDLLDNHIRQNGSRNRATLTLATYYRDQGFTEAKTAAKLVPWALRAPADLTSTKDHRALSASTKSVIKTVYETQRYHFACSFIRALGTPKMPIRCSFDQCNVTNAQDQEPENPIELHLSDASRAEFMGKKLKVKVQASGKDTSPYIIGSKYRVTCFPDADRENSKCKSCQMLTRGGMYEFSLGPKTPEVLKLVASSDLQIKGVIRELAGIYTRCSSHKIEALESMNVEEIKLIPQIDNEYREVEYVVRRGYYLGQGFKINQEYDVTAYTWPDPRTQYAVHLFGEASSSVNSLATFKMTPELRQELAVFQVGEDGSIAEKFAEIHQDLERNVTRVWGRADVAMAVDLVYHSVLSFSFQEEIVPRGWLQLLILGDTRQAKSQIVERLMRHFALGYKVSGESASRTGLVYSIQENAKRWFLTWGVIPMHDRRLVAIDEFSGLREEEIELMSDLRSTGVAEVMKVISARTNARTRLVFISNPRNGQALSTYTFGIEAVKELMGKNEDVARLDFAVTAASGEVADSVINRSIKDVEGVPHRYTSYLCRQLILWAWTRTAEQVRFTEDAESEILRQASEIAGHYVSDIPLVEPAELRIKLARLAAAAAARTFSTADGESLTVTRRHVEFVAAYLQHIYDDSALNYGRYSDLKRQGQASSSEIEAIHKEILQFPKPGELVDAMLNAQTFFKRDLEDVLGYDADQIKELFRWLNQRRLIQRFGQRGFRKSPLGIKFFLEAAFREAAAAKRVIPNDGQAF